MRLFYSFLVLAALVLVTFLVWGEGFMQWFTGDAAVLWIRNQGARGWLAVIGLLMSDLVLPLPATAIMSAAGYLYGTLAGGLISVAGSFCAGMLGYGLCRCLGRNIAARLAGEEALAKNESLFHRWGPMLVAGSRWVPILPEVISCLAGLVRMPLPIFAWSLACGSIPLGFAYAWIGATGQAHPGLAIGLSVLLPVVLWMIVHPWLKRESAEADAEVAAMPRFHHVRHFIRRRFAADHHLGLHLTIGLVVICGLTWGFAELAETIREEGHLVAIDLSTSEWMHRQATPALTRTAVFVTFLGSGEFLTVVCLGIAVWLWRKRARLALLALVLMMGGGALLMNFLKLIYQRGRPLPLQPLDPFKGYSFPSGHVMCSALFAASVLYIVAVTIPHRRRHRLHVPLAILFVIVIALTRIYLGAHFVSDTMAATAAGTAWAFCCITAVETLRKRPRQE